jgi:hypothetical protein
VLASDWGLASEVCASGADGFARFSDPAPQLTNNAQAAATDSGFMVIAVFPR